MPASTQPPLEIHSGIVLKGQLSMIHDVVLTGRFEGDLKTLGQLTVASGGTARGTIDAGSLVLEPGNLVEARIKVSPAPAKPVSKTLESAGKSLAGAWSAGLQKVRAAFGRK